MNQMMILGQMLKSGGNPMQLVMNMLQQQMGGNQMAQNMFNMIQSGDNKGIEKMAKNMCNSNGITPEQAINEARKYFGMK